METRSKRRRLTEKPVAGPVASFVLRKDLCERVLMPLLGCCDSIAFRTSCSLTMTYQMNDRSLCSQSVVPVPVEWLARQRFVSDLRDLEISVLMTELAKFFELVATMSLERLKLTIFGTVLLRFSSLILCSETLKDLTVRWCAGTQLVCPFDIESTIIGGLRTPNLETLQIESYSRGDNVWCSLDLYQLPKLSLVRSVMKSGLRDYSALNQVLTRKVSLDLYVHQQGHVSTVSGTEKYFAMVWGDILCSYMDGTKSTLFSTILREALCSGLSICNVQFKFDAGSKMINLHLDVESGTVHNTWNPYLVAFEDERVVKPIQSLMQTLQPIAYLRLHECIFRNVLDATWNQLQTLGIPNLIRN